MAKREKEAVLFVDDEGSVLSLFEESLRVAFQIFTATSGLEGLKTLEKHPHIAVVVADHKMPGMSGIQFLQEVQKRYPHKIRLLLTAYSDFEIALNGVNRAQVYRYLLKPLDMREMRLELRRAVDLYRLRMDRDRQYQEKVRALEELEQYRGQLEQKVAQRTKELEEALKELKEMQSKMVHAERLRVRGQVVCDIAQEVNNPFQAAMGSFEALHREMKDWTVHIKNNGLQEKVGNERLEMIDQALNLMDRNMKRIYDRLSDLQRFMAEP
ncbi:MAG: response regulator [Deltaproteobacteria bacterium]|nr:response regulator [Deltaproteobacteria bacterium]